MKYLILIIAFTNVLFADTTMNYLSIFFIEEIIVTIYLGFNVVFSYIFYDVIGVYWFFLIIAIAMFMYQYLLKLGTIQISQIYSFFYKDITNNIITKFLFYSVFVGFLMFPVSVDTWKATEVNNSLLYTKTLKNVDGKKINLSLDFLINEINKQNGTNIENKVPFLSMLILSLPQRVFYGIPFMQEIDENDKVFNENISALTLIQKLVPSFKKSFSSYANEPSKLLDMFIDHLSTIVLISSDKEAVRNIYTKQLERFVLNLNKNVYVNNSYNTEIKNEEPIEFYYFDYINGDYKNDRKTFIENKMGGYTEEKNRLLTKQEEAFKDYLESMYHTFRTYKEVIETTYKLNDNLGINVFVNNFLVVTGFQKILSDSLNGFKFSESLHLFEIVDNAQDKDLLEKLVNYEKKSNITLTDNEKNKIRSMINALFFQNNRVTNTNLSVLVKSYDDYKESFNKDNKLLQATFLILRNKLRTETKEIFNKFNESDIEPLKLSKNPFLEEVKIVPVDFGSVESYVYAIEQYFKKMNNQDYLNILKKYDLKKVGNLIEFKNEIISLNAKNLKRQHKEIKFLEYESYFISEYAKDLKSKYDLFNANKDFIEDLKIEYYPTKTVFTTSDKQNFYLNISEKYQEMFITSIHNEAVKKIIDFEETNTIKIVNDLRKNIFTDKILNKLNGYVLTKVFTKEKNIENALNDFTKVFIKDIQNMGKGLDNFKETEVIFNNEEKYYKSLDQEVSNVFNIVSEAGTIYNLSVKEPKELKDFNIYKADNNNEIFNKIINIPLPNQKNNSLILEEHIVNVVTSYEDMIKLITIYTKTSQAEAFIKDSVSMTGILSKIYDKTKELETKDMFYSPLVVGSVKLIKTVVRPAFDGLKKTKNTETKTTLTTEETVSLSSLAVFILPFESTIVQVGSFGTMIGNESLNSEVMQERKVEQKTDGIFGKLKSGWNSIKETVSEINPKTLIPKLQKNVGKLMLVAFYLIIIGYVLIQVYKLFLTYYTNMYNYFGSALKSIYLTSIGIFTNETIQEFQKDLENNFKELAIKSIVNQGFIVFITFGIIVGNGMVDFIFNTFYLQDFIKKDTPSTSLITEAVIVRAMLIVLWLKMLMKILNFFIEIKEDTKIQQYAENKASNVKNNITEKATDLKDNMVKKPIENPKTDIKPAKKDNRSKLFPKL